MFSRGYRAVLGAGHCWILKSSTPLDPILDEIELALDAKFFYLAIALTTTLPDMCAALISDDGRSEPRRYKAWLDENRGDKFSFLTAKDFYSLRCGVVHQGRLGDLQHDIKRVVFLLPGRGTIINGQINDAYVYSAVDFCHDLMDIVRAWYETHSDDPNVVKNVPNLVRYRPDGMVPYIVGQAVIA
jgi:hypothetical protein